MMSCLRIKDLHVSVDGKEILKGLSLDIHSGETHALMGPNGNGKSTLLAAIMGNPKFQVTGGSITLDDQDVLAMEVDERSKAGLFLGMQYPSEVSGVTRDLQMKEDLAHRFLNEGFSGGEKKRNEIVQMKLLKPSIAMLDEIDSGLDVDALKIVAEAVAAMQREQNMGLVIVSHYARFYELLKPTHAHVLVDGRIVVSGGSELVEKIDQQGYDWIEQEYDVQVVREEEKKVELLGSCGASRGA